MSNSFAAICSDFYINQKIALKMDLPTRRETVLDMFDRVRKALPSMDRFRRYDDELALESADEDSRYSWLAMRRTSIRSGWVNPGSLDQAYKLHRLVLEIAPYFLSISPLDVDYIELIFGFDLACQANRNEVVFDALLADTPLSGLVDTACEPMTDVQPFIGLSLDETCSLKAFVEVKTHTRMAEVMSRRWADEPISVYLTIRQDGPLQSVEQFNAVFGTLAGYAERLSEDRVIPNVVMPIRDTLMSRPG
ncbi:MAG: hypothetical protein AAF432_07960 [Planctomycetota bacterium]